MYNHRTERERVDIVDLDPYGTAAPFIDAAVQCVNDGGQFVSKRLSITLLMFSIFKACYVSHVPTFRCWLQ